MSIYNFYRLKTNDTVIYIVWTMRQLITLWYVTTNRKLCWIRAVITGVSVIKRLSLYEFSPWDRDFMSVVLIIEGPYYRGYFYKEMYGHFPGTKWTVRNREVSVRRGSTVFLSTIDQLLTWAHAKSPRVGQADIPLKKKRCKIISCVKCRWLFSHI